MRILALLLLLFTPALAKASFDYKCEHADGAEPVTSWLHFGFAGRGGQAQMEYWKEYPPISLLEADLDNGSSLPENSDKLRYVSEADRANGNVAVIDLPSDFLSQDKFSGRFELRPKDAHDQPSRSVYELTCIRH
ncbi:MAG TPA: hypothetical protein VIH99_12880 [Bdellovibrionota bacterium]|jgi:hypothetical protein